MCLCVSGVGEGDATPPPPPTTTYQQEHPFSCTNQQNQKITFNYKFSNCFSFRNISHTKIGFYTYLKKKKKKKRKRLRHSLRSTLNYHYDCLIWTLKKRLVSNYYCFSVRNISHTKIGFYTYLKKKKKKKKKKAKKIKTQFKVYLKLSLWLFNLNFEKEISQ